MKKIIPLILCLATVCATIPASAQVRVVKSADRKINLDISGLRLSTDSESQLFFQTLERNLRLSGWIEPRRGGGELRLVGTVGREGNALRIIGQVYPQGGSDRLFSKSYRGETAQARGLAQRMADDLVEALTGHQGIASCRLVLVGERNGIKELFLSDLDGGGLTQITQDRKVVVGPRWSPDGDSIVFTSYLRGFPDVYRADLRRGRRELLSAYGGLNTGSAISPDGRELALILSKDGNPELYIKNLRSGQLTRLTNTPRAVEASPAWSPDGRELVYVSDQGGTPQLYIISREGGRPRRISTRGSENVAPDWGPNGLIACASRSGGRYLIAVIHPVTGETTYLQTDGADYEDPSWAPNGRHIVASRTVRSQPSSIYLLDTLGDAPVALLQGGGSWYSPSCSPRGR